MCYLNRFISLKDQSLTNSDILLKQSLLDLIYLQMVVIKRHFFKVCSKESEFERTKYLRK